MAPVPRAALDEAAWVQPRDLWADRPQRLLCPILHRPHRHLRPQLLEPGSAMGRGLGPKQFNQENQHRSLTLAENWGRFAKIRFAYTGKNIYVIKSALPVMISQDRVEHQTCRSQTSVSTKHVARTDQARQAGKFCPLRRPRALRPPPDRLKGNYLFNLIDLEQCARRRSTRSIVFISRSCCLKTQSDWYSGSVCRLSTAQHSNGAHGIFPS